MLTKLCENLNENYLDVKIIQRGNIFHIVELKIAIKDARYFSEELDQKLVNNTQFELKNKELNIKLNALAQRAQAEKKEKFIPNFQVMISLHLINLSIVNQERYLKYIQENDNKFGVALRGEDETCLPMTSSVTAYDVYDRIKVRIY